MNRAIRVLSCIGLAIAVGGTGPGAVGQNADEAAVNKRIDGVYQALRTKDVKAYVAAFHANAVRAVGSSVSVGRAAIEKAVAAQLATVAPAITFTRHATWLASPTTAIVHGASEDTSTKPASRGHSTFTLVKEGNEWLIAAVQTAPASTQ